MYVMLHSHIKGLNEDFCTGGKHYTFYWADIHDYSPARIAELEAGLSVPIHFA